MARAPKGNKRVVKGDIETTPEGAVWRGEYVTWGGRQRKVFIESRDLTKKVPLIDPITNGAMYKRGAEGQFLGTVHTQLEKIGEEEREFILDDLGNGQTEKVYGRSAKGPGFRADPEEAKRKEKAAERERIMNELVDRAVEAGGIDALLSGAADEDGGEEVYPKHIGGPKWQLSNKEYVAGNRAHAEAAEAALHLDTAA